MKTIQASAPARVTNILYLTDFSPTSEAALPFLIALGRGYGAKVHALHVLMPTPYPYTGPGLAAAALEAEEEDALAEMKRVGYRLESVHHETTIQRGMDVWSAVEQAIQEDHIDLIIVGTSGRTGTEKLLLGSVAEEIFRRSPVPVLTIGPGARSSFPNESRFSRILFATDFTPESLAASPYAISLAQQNRAHLDLLFVMPTHEELNQHDTKLFEGTVAEAIQRLHEIVPKETKFEFPPKAFVEYGEPAKRISEVAGQRGSDLIALGIRHTTHVGAATHLEGSVAHKVIVHAPCAVLTVRS
ncbi:MAG: universal stress protein [Candidatus Acidiferrales bacterium]